MSIGDGANDVPMILEAHIGVGIRGKEGTQAVRSADFALSQFFYLQRLLLCHGRWGYRRVSWLVCYYFYKNVVLVFTEIYFSLENGFSGQIFFADWLQTLYNAAWTSWACLFAYALEQVSGSYSFILFVGRERLICLQVPDCVRGRTERGLFQLQSLLEMDDLCYLARRNNLLWDSLCKSTLFLTQNLRDSSGLLTAVA